MFTKKLHKPVVLLLIAAMLLTMLAGCGDNEETPPPTSGPEPTQQQDPTEPPGPTPNEILSAAFEASMGDLRARFDASPLSRLTGLTGEGSRTVEFDTSMPEENNLHLTGTLIADSASGMADLTLTFPDAGLTALCHYDSEFLGVSLEKLFGDKRYYGLRPYGITQQLEGSAFASILELDMNAIAQLDEALSAIPREKRPASAPLLDTFTALALDYIGKAELKTEGDEFSCVLTSRELAEFLKKYAESCPVLEDVFAVLGGTGDLDAVLASIEKDGADTALTFLVAGERVRHISAEYKKPDGTVYLEAELYGVTGDLLSVTLEPYFTLELTLNGGVHMALNTSTGDGADTSLNWAADGTLDFITYSNDVTNLALEGTLTVDGGNMRYEGIWFSGNRGDRNPITLTVAPGGEVKVPEETVSLAELSEREIFRIIARSVIGLL